MQKKQIEKLAKATFYRAVRESIAGIFVLIFFAYYLQYSPTGSAKYYGCLIIIAAIGFILGVVWSFTISHRVVRRHSSEDSLFWREAFETQARLLRFVPLWYVAPLTIGILLFSTPTRESDFSQFIIKLAITFLISGYIIYLNKIEADKLEAEAVKL